MLFLILKIFIIRNKLIIREFVYDFFILLLIYNVGYNFHFFFLINLYFSLYGLLNLITNWTLNIIINCLSILLIVLFSFVFTATLAMFFRIWGYAFLYTITILWILTLLTIFYSFFWRAAILVIGPRTFVGLFLNQT